MLSQLGLWSLGSSLQLGHEPTGWSGQAPLLCVAHWRHFNYSTIRYSWQSRCFTAIGFLFSLHTSGHSAEESCITEALEAQVRSKSWFWGVSKPFLQTWYFCWQTFCSCPLLQSLNQFLSICWEKGFLAEEKKRRLMCDEIMRVLGRQPWVRGLWGCVTHCQHSLTSVRALPCLGSSWTRASISALQLMEAHLPVLDLGL